MIFEGGGRVHGELAIAGPSVSAVLFVMELFREADVHFTDKKQ